MLLRATWFRPNLRRRCRLTTIFEFSRVAAPQSESLSRKSDSNNQLRRNQRFSSICGGATRQKFEKMRGTDKWDWTEVNCNSRKYHKTFFFKSRIWVPQHNPKKKWISAPTLRLNQNHTKELPLKSEITQKILLENFQKIVWTRYYTTTLTFRPPANTPVFWSLFCSTKSSWPMT